MRILLFFKFSLIVCVLVSPSILFSQGAIIKDGNWELTLNKEMNNVLSEQLTMLKTIAMTEPSVYELAKEMEMLFEGVRQPRSITLSVEQAERGVISIFEMSDHAINSSNQINGGCTYKIEWLEKIIGTVSGKCKDGSIIKGEVSVPNDLNAQYKGTITPVDGSPYPIGWDAKWLGSDSYQTDEVY